MLMGRQCPYCPAVRASLERLSDEGVIGSLETVVIEDHPEVAAEYGVRSVPWVQIGPFELPGLRAEEELRDWAEKAGSLQGMAKYLAELIASGNIDKCVRLIQADSHQLKALLLLFTDPDTGLNVLIGVSAIMEALQGSTTLAGIGTDLRDLLTHDEARIRGDACHYLSLTGLAATDEWIRPLLGDADSNVRQIAADCLADLAANS